MKRKKTHEDKENGNRDRTCKRHKQNLEAGRLSGN